MADFSHLADLPETEDDYRADIARRLRSGELTPERARMLVARGDARQENVKRLIDELFCQPYRESRVGTVTGFSTDDDQMLVESAIDLANAKNTNELRIATDAFATWFNARPAGRNEFDESEWRLLQPAVLSDEVAESLVVLKSRSTSDKEQLRDNLLVLPPRLPLVTDISIDEEGRMRIFCSLVDCYLHDILDYALLLLLDPSRDFGRLRRCKYKPCSRWFLAQRDDNVFCPTRTGRLCKKADYDKRTGTARKRRYRDNKRRDARRKQEKKKQ